VREYAVRRTPAPQAMFETFGQFIRLARIERNLTQARLAELAGVSRRQLHQMERGANVSLAFLVKVAGALELTEVPIGFLTLRAATAATPALLAAAKALAVMRNALKQTHEASVDLECAAEELGALRARAAEPGDVS